MTTSLLHPRTLLATLLLLGTTAPLAAQNTSRPGDREFRWSGTGRDGALLRAANISGNIRVTAVEGSRVELVATRRGSDDDMESRVEVREHAGGITVCALHEADWTCEASGPDNESRRGRRSRHREERAYYDFELRVPRGMRVAASSVSGDVGVTGTTTELRATTVSGDVRLDRIRATDELTATSVSGDVRAQLDAVDRGTELSLRSVSGDIAVMMPPTTGFSLRMSTVSGGLETDFPLELRGRMNRRSVEARVNDGSSDLRVSTVSGDVRLAHNNN